MKPGRNQEGVEYLLVYLGRRGGGAQLLIEIVSSFASDSYPASRIHVLRAADGEYLANTHLRKTDLEIPHSIKSILFHPKLIVSTIFITLKTYANLRPKWTVFIMPSPFDWFVDICASFFKSKKLFMIHDAEPHLGEKWPTKKSIYWRIRRANQIIVFSNHIKEKISGINCKVPIEVYSLPTTLYQTLDDSHIGQDILQISQDFILFIGRIQKYKGVDYLIDAHQSFHQDKLLVIAGSGDLKFTGKKNISLINRWLNSNEILFLIKHARIVVFPYLEASQSGLLPIAIQSCKPVLISNLPGLVEQANDHTFLEITPVADVPELSKGITRAWERGALSKASRLVSNPSISSRLQKTTKSWPR
jgi:glycosyltransferase involved in cell wall biosynthesis